MSFCSRITNRGDRHVRQAGRVAGFPCVRNRERISSPSSDAHVGRIKHECLDTLRVREAVLAAIPPPGSLLQEEEDVFAPPRSRQTLPGAVKGKTPLSCKGKRGTG